jgi:hypothetical protein
MDSIQLFAQTQGGVDYSSYVELDLYESDPIKITKSIQSVEDPQATTSSFSNNYRLPNTSVNGQFFKAVFNVNSTDFNAVQKANAYINVNGAYFISGNIRLTNIITNSASGKIEYEIIFFGQTSTFASVVGPKDLSQIDLTEYTHPATYTNIRNSWQNGLFSGDIIYPLAEWGYTYNQTTKIPTIPTLARYNATTGVKGFTNSINPLLTEQFKPAIRAKVIWDKIFQGAGFTYSSNFLNSSFFTSLYMISTNTASAVLESELRSDALVKPKGLSLEIGPNPVGDLLEYSQIVFDNVNGINLNNSTYTAPFTGTYTIRFTLNFEYSTFNFAPEDDYVIILVQFFSNDDIISSVDGFLYGTGGGFSSDFLYSEFFGGANSVGLDNTNFQQSFNLNQGDVLTIRLYPLYGFFYASVGNVGSVSIVGPDVLDPAGLLPVQYKQLEFIKGINDRFKLMWEPDPQNPTNFYIEPWVSWINGGDQKDWTDKMDNSFDVTLTPLFNTQPREYIFKDSEESDLYNFAYQQTNKETFGQLNQDSGIEIITGKKEIKSIFAPLQVAPIGNSEDFLIPHFAKDTELERQPIQVKPRLAFYNGLIPAPVGWYMKNGIFSVLQTTYPLMSNFDTWPFNSSSFDISWNNVPQFWDPEFNFGPSATGATGATGEFNGRTSKTAYNTYWGSWFNSTYDPYGRIMKGTFILDSVDVQSLAFNDKIFIKDSWWLPLKINDFVVGQKQKTKVELLKLGNVGISIESLNPIVYSPYNMHYSSVDPESSCCQSVGSFPVIVYSASFPSLSTNLYSDNAGVVTAPAGFYTLAPSTYTVNQSGFITGVTGCDPNNCTLSIDFVDLIYSPTDIVATCCGTVANASAYYTGPNFYTSPALYGNETLTIPVSSGWWGIDGNSVFVGKNGVVTQVANCGAYDCANLLPFSMFLNRGNDYGGNSVNSTCCIYPTSGSGSIGIGTIFSDAPFDDGSLFYYAPDMTLPVAPSSPSQILSDGETYVSVFQGIAYPGGTCAAPSTCPGRTYLTDFNFNNFGATTVEAVIRFEISWDNNIWFFNGERSVSINPSSYAFEQILYDPTSFVRFTLSCTQSGKIISIEFEGQFDFTTTPTVYRPNSVGPCANFSSITATFNFDDF